MSLTRYSCRVIFIASCLLAWRLSPELSGQENRTTNAQGESQKTVGDAKPNLLTGRFVIDGEPAERKRIDANYGAHALLKSLPVGALEEILIVGEDRGIANVFVYVRSKDIPFDKPQERKAPTKVSVVKGQFSPHALAVQSPRKLLFENSAEAPINVRTQFLNNVNQNRVVATGQNFEIALKPEKIPVQYNCDIYPWMHGWILVSPHPYAAVSDASGNFTINGLPTGEWEFQVWHERVGSLKTADWPKGRFTLDIKHGKNNLGIVKLKPEVLENRR